MRHFLEEMIPGTFTQPKVWVGFLACLAGVFDEPVLSEFENNSEPIFIFAGLAG